MLRVGIVALVIGVLIAALPLSYEWLLPIVLDVGLRAADTIMWAQLLTLAGALVVITLCFALHKTGDAIRARYPGTNTSALAVWLGIAVYVAVLALAPR